MEHNQKDKMKEQKGTKGRKVRHVLEDHAQYGKQFRPPLLDYMLTAGHGPPNLEWVRWALPEMLWIKLLIREHGLRRAGELVHAAVKAGRAVASVAGRSYSLASDYMFTEEEQAKSPDKEIPRAGPGALIIDKVSGPEEFYPVKKWIPSHPIPHSRRQAIPQKENPGGEIKQALGKRQEFPVESGQGAKNRIHGAKT